MSCHANDMACVQGRSDAHVVPLPGYGGKHQLGRDAAVAFSALVARAARSGFDLRPVSTWRSYDQQLQIFNGKAIGARPVHDDAGARLLRTDFSAEEWLHRVLRFSALPGTSRHHWGSDIDIVDRRALPPGYELQLSPGEYAEGGVQAGVAQWLEERVAEDDAEGFTRPYAIDGGGVAPEPWHLSHRTTAQRWRSLAALEDLLPVWRGLGGATPLELFDEVEARAEQLWARYVMLD